MGDYRLVRVGVSPDFLRLLQGKEVVEGKVGKACEKSDVRVENGTVLHRIGLWKRRSRRLEKEAERRKHARLMEEASVREEFLQDIVTDIDRSSFFCKEKIPFLEGWQFRGYLEEEWVQHMMKYIGLPHLVFLGRVPFLYRLLLPYMKRSKTVRWILPKHQYGEAEQDLVEDICEQYGLLVEVQLLESEKDYCRLRLTGKQPVVIVDFSEEDRITAADLPAGSIWLDMGASETKEARMEERQQKILYFSLKKEWKQPEKALFYLDTTHKNGYNTKVNWTH